MALGNYQWVLVTVDSFAYFIISYMKDHTEGNLLFFIFIHIAVCIISFFFFHFNCKIVSQCMDIPQNVIQFLSSHLLMDIEWLIFHLGFVPFLFMRQWHCLCFFFSCKVILRYFSGKVILASSVVGKVKQLHVNQ